MNIFKSCFRGVECCVQKICYFFGRITQCCKGKPKVKGTIIPDDFVELVKKIEDRKVYLIPENHFSSADNSFQREIVGNISRKKLIYAMEGVERDAFSEKELRKAIGLNEDANLYGIEDAFFTIFNHASDLNMNLKDYNPNAIPEFLTIIHNTKTDLLCSFVNKTNQSYLDNFWSNKLFQTNPIFKFLQANKEVLISKDLEQQVEIFERKIGGWTNASWVELTKGVVLILAPDLKKNLPEKNHRILEYLLGTIDKKGISDNQTEFLKFRNALQLDLRNDFIADNLANVYNITKDLKKPLVSILGEHHIPGITKLLCTKGFTILGKKELDAELKKS